MLAFFAMRACGLQLPRQFLCEMQLKISPLQAHLKVAEAVVTL